jgi:tryptophan synthase beta subunit
LEGIIIALETAHAFAKVFDVAQRESDKRGRAVRVALCLSGRGISTAVCSRER